MPRVKSGRVPNTRFLLSPSVESRHVMCMTLHNKRSSPELSCPEFEVNYIGLIN